MGKIFNGLKTLFQGGRTGASMGRLAFMITFGISVWRWCHDKDIPEYMFYVLVISMGYVFGSKWRSSKVKLGQLTVDSETGPKPRAEAKGD